MFIKAELVDKIFILFIKLGVAVFIILELSLDLLVVKVQLDEGVFGFLQSQSQTVVLVNVSTDIFLFFGDDLFELLHLALLLFY